MASIAMMVGGAIVNALAFTGSNFLFSQVSSSAERKRHDIAMEKLQKDRDSWSAARLQRLDYINEKLKKEGHAEKTFRDVDAAMRAYHDLIIGDRLEDFPPEPELEDYLDEDQADVIKTGELAIVGAGMLLTGYLVYEYI
jgi:hypothetical protein